MSQPKGSTGVSLGGRLVVKPSRAKLIRILRARQEARWAAKSGPVRVRQANPDELARLNPPRKRRRHRSR